MSEEKHVDENSIEAKLEQTLKILDNTLLKLTEVTLRVSALEKLLTTKQELSNSSLFSQEQLAEINKQMVDLFLAEYKQNLTATLAENK